MFNFQLKNYGLLITNNELFIKTPEMENGEWFNEWEFRVNDKHNFLIVFMDLTKNGRNSDIAIMGTNHLTFLGNDSFSI